MASSPWAPCWADRVDQCDNTPEHLSAASPRPQNTNDLEACWVPNRIADTDGEKTVNSWFNVSDFQVVPAGTFGNAGRNILRGPGSLAATLRYDVFNLTNRTNFGNPNADVTATNRATITSLAGDPRSR